MALQVSVLAAPPESEERSLPVSLARIRAALVRTQESPSLALDTSAENPTFRIEIRERKPLQWNVTTVDDEPFDMTWGLPSAGQLMMAGIGKLQDAVVRYRRTRAERRARREVEDALAAFCAVRDCTAAAIAHSAD